MRKFLHFDSMLTPKIITLVYWFLLVSAVFTGIGVMFGGYMGFTFLKFIGGLLTIAGGALAARIWCELLIVLFKMNEALQDLRNK